MSEDEDEGWYAGGSKALSVREFEMPRLGERISIVQEHTGSAELWAQGQGGVVWEAANAVVLHLDDVYAPRGMGELGTVVELGSGTGLCGMACAALGAKRVLLTDLAEALPLLQRNASASQWTSQLEVHTLKWGETLPSGCEPFGLVVACDCLCMPCNRTQAPASKLTATSHLSSLASMRQIDPKTTRHLRQLSPLLGPLL